MHELVYSNWKFIFLMLKWNVILNNLLLFLYRPEGNQALSKDKVKSEASDISPLNSPTEGVQVLDPSHLPDDSNDDLSSLVDSPGSEPSAISDNAEFTKMSVYSPSQEQFSIPEDIGTEAQSSTSLSSSAVSDVQGAKHYLSESDYPVSSSSEQSSSFYSPSTTRSYSFSQPPTVSHSPIISPSTYPAAFNPQAFPTGGTDGMMASAMYPNGACMSPSPYMSPYSAGKQYTWPTTPNAYGTFSMNSHDLMQQAGYASTYQSGTYSQMTTMSRPGYPATYFPQQVTATTHAA